MDLGVGEGIYVDESIRIIDLRYLDLVVMEKVVQWEAALVKNYMLEWMTLYEANGQSIRK